MKHLHFFIALCLLLLTDTTYAATGERAESKYTETSTIMTIEATWQRFGIDGPDAMSDALVLEAVRTFRSTAAQEYIDLKDLRDKNGSALSHFEMVLSGVISDNGRTAGILWHKYQYLGGAHGGLDVSSTNCTLPDGRVFHLTELFRKPDTALHLISELSRKELQRRELPWDMIRSGTEPDIENFDTFLLTADGLTLYFSPYQVAPWSEGVVTVSLSLDDLSEAAPVTAYWK